MNEHTIALTAVARDRNGVPNCADWRLTAARDAGLIKFHGWPSGHWQITAAGRDYLASDDEKPQ